MYNISYDVVNKLLFDLRIDHVLKCILKSLLVYSNQFRVLTEFKCSSMSEGGKPTAIMAVGKENLYRAAFLGECMAHSIGLGTMCTELCVSWLLGKGVGAGVCRLKA